MAIVDFSLKDKVAVVSGASRGIGESVAKALAEQGASLVICGRKQEGLDRVASEIEAEGGKCLPLTCHTGHMDQITALFEKVKSELGKVDILVNNAATNPYFGDVLNISESAYDKTFEVNTKGYFFMAQAAGKMMMAQGGGNIINTASIAGLEAAPMQGVYGMTKAAVISMTKSFAYELAPFKIRVNAVCPGLTETKFAKVLIDSKPIYDAAMTKIPMKRHAVPDEIAGAVLYLASEASSYVTGTYIVVDGGGTL